MSDKDIEAGVRPFGAARLLRLRNEKGLTQRAVAAEAGISQALYNELERGKHPLLKRHAEKLAKPLGPAVLDLLPTS